MEGNAAELSPFRFSSEYADDDVGLVCYNYHYFNPMDGRWISRYPIQESDSGNLYEFTRNNSIYISDFLGLLFLFFLPSIRMILN